MRGEIPFKRLVPANVPFPLHQYKQPLRRGYKAKFKFLKSLTSTLIKQNIARKWRPIFFNVRSLVFYGSVHGTNLFLGGNFEFMNTWNA